MINYDIGANEAMWTSNGILYGNGDGVQFGPMVSLDMIAHEMTHGLVSYTAQLNYVNESGAVEESFCDVFAAMVEYRLYGDRNQTWQIGEDVYTPSIPGDALRYLNEPTWATNENFTANDDPDYYANIYLGDLDNGGIHHNSGVGNKAFYLVAKGGNHSHGGSMTGIGPIPAIDIWYRALTVYMTPSTDFLGARIATMNAARDLFGSASDQLNAVETAWGLCGVGTIPPPNLHQIIINGGFEVTIIPWTIFGLSGATFISRGAGAHNGTGYVILGGANSVTASVYQSNITIPSTTVYGNFSFYMQITTGETTIVSINDQVSVNLRGTGGSLIANLAVFSNLNASPSYFLAGPYSLQPYKGQTVTVEFAVSTNSNLITSFKLDDVSIIV